MRAELLLCSHHSQGRCARRRGGLKTSLAGWVCTLVRTLVIPSEHTGASLVTDVTTSNAHIWQIFETDGAEATTLQRIEATF